MSWLIVRPCGILTLVPISFPKKPINIGLLRLNNSSNCKAIALNNECGDSSQGIKFLFSQSMSGYFLQSKPYCSIVLTFIKFLIQYFGSSLLVPVLIDENTVITWQVQFVHVLATIVLPSKMGFQLLFMGAIKLENFILYIICDSKNWLHIWEVPFRLYVKLHVTHWKQFGNLWAMEWLVELCWRRLWQGREMVTYNSANWRLF